MADTPEVKPGLKKLVYSAITAGVAYAFTLVPSFEALPAEVTTALPAVVAAITFWVIPERYLVKIGESYVDARDSS